MKAKKVVLQSPIKAYCPIMKATLSINSTLLEQMSEFTQFVLYSIGRNKAISDIVEIVDLGSYIVEEEIEFLRKIGLICIEDEAYQLSDKGMEYFDVIKIIENIEEDDLKVHINCFNGRIMSPVDDITLKKDLDVSDEKLRVKIVKELYQNKDYANSREYVFNKLGEIFEDNDNINLDNIYITIDYERGDIYVPVDIPEVSSINYKISEDEYLKESAPVHDEDDFINDIQLKRDILELNVEVDYAELEPYKNTLSTLHNLMNFDPELLSKKSEDLIKLWKTQQSINMNIYLDTATNEILTKLHYTSGSSELQTLSVNRQYTEDDVDLYVLEQLIIDKEWYRRDVTVDFRVIATHSYYEGISSLDYIV